MVRKVSEKKLNLIFEISSLPSPKTIQNKIFLNLLLEFLWEAYIGSRQKKIYQTKVTVPKELENILDQETFTKARLYALDK